MGKDGSDANTQREQWGTMRRGRGNFALLPPAQLLLYILVPKQAETGTSLLLGMGDSCSRTWLECGKS